MMFDYTICNQPDADIFKRQCQALEKHIPNIEKNRMITDVDGSKTQHYSLGGKNITVHNSYYVGAVYIESEVDLTQFFFDTTK